MYEITCRISVKGFNFLVNSYWSEVEQRIEDYLPVIFAPGNPELFHTVCIASKNDFHMMFFF